MQWSGGVPRRPPESGQAKQGNAPLLQGLSPVAHPDQVSVLIGSMVFNYREIGFCEFFFLVEILKA